MKTHRPHGTKGNSALNPLTTALALLLALPAGLAAQPPSSAHYVLKDLGTLGGPNSFFSPSSKVLNSSGTAVGVADTADLAPCCGSVSHAFKWNNGRLVDLGTLPGGNDFSNALAINSSGAIIGISSNGDPDPTFGEVLFVATLWKDGGITSLGSLGGTYSVPEAINDLGQIAGGAATTIPDPNGTWGDVKDIPSATLWHAALWESGTIRDLGTLGGPASYAYFIDARGRVVGQSYTANRPSKNGTPLIHPFFWENGRMTDIGTLGGVFAEANAMNSLGQVVGASNLRGDTTFHAFLWSQGHMVDLGVLKDRTISVASAINDLGAVVGWSCSQSLGCDGFLWRDGVMTDLGTLGTTCTSPKFINNKGQVVGDNCADHGGTVWLWQDGVGFIDLNTLVPPGSDMHLFEAAFFDDSGEILGFGQLPNGDVHAFALTPTGIGSN